MMCQTSSTLETAIIPSTHNKQEQLESKAEIRPNKTSSSPDHLRKQFPSSNYSNDKDLENNVKHHIGHESEDSSSQTLDNITNNQANAINGINPESDQSGLLDHFKPYGQEDCCDFNPEFAIICSFIAQFGDKIDLELNIEQLKSTIEDQSQIGESLIDLQVKLLKKIRRYFVRDQWEKALIRFASEYSYEDAYEIERLGYQKARPSIKIQLLRRLLEAQFECDQKFKSSVNLCEANELRILPIGRDTRGNTYWQRTDNEGNLKIFQEQPLDYKSWKAICSSPAELNNLIEELENSKEEKIKGEPIMEPYNPLPEIFPEYFCKPEKVEEKEIQNDDKKSTKTKKASRGRVGRAKKSNPLPALKEVEEERSDYGSRISDAVDQKVKTEQIIFDNQVQSHPEHSPIESQVRTTLENLINKVVSSFEFLIRPLSRNSQEKEEQEQQMMQPTAKPRKRQSVKRAERIKAEVLPRRSSSRIQQLQLKKVAEQEEEMKKMIESSANKGPSFVVSSLDDDSRSRTSSKNNKRRSESPDESKNGKKKRRQGQSWKRGKGKKKLSWDKDDSDLSSTSNLTESNDEFEETYKFESNNYDDEFACEDEETNIEPVIVKRARTARQSLGVDEQRDLNTSSIIEEDKPCGRCDKSNDPEWILLCDMCDDGYHTSCCLPPLMMVPDGDWFCPPCEHKMLLQKLKELYASVIEVIEAKELELKKKQRLRQNNAKKSLIKSDEPEKLPEKRQRIAMDEFNDPTVSQALDEELDETESESESSSESFDGRARNRRKAKTKPKFKSKRAATRRPKCEEGFSMEHRRPRKTYSRRDMSESEAESTNPSSDSSDEIIPKTRRARASVSYKFQEYDELIKSAINGDSYDEVTSDEESADDNCNYGRGKDMATIEALAYQQENGFIEHNANEKDDKLDPTKKPKKKARRLNDLDADSEIENASDESFQASSATEAEDEDEDLTEEDSYDDSETSIDEIVHTRDSRSHKKKRSKRRSYDSDESDYLSTRTRRAASKKISYKESSDDEDLIDSNPINKKSKKHTLSSGEESQASWKSNNTSIVEDDRSTSCEDSASFNPLNVDLQNNIEEVESTTDKSIQLPVESSTISNAVEKPTELAVEKDPQQMLDKQVDKQKAKEKFTKVRLEKRNKDSRPIIDANMSLDGSYDEIAAPLFNKNQPAITSEFRPIYVDQSKSVEQTNLKIAHVTDDIRDPIQELNQYCNESANTATMFNSYNEALLKKSFESPVSTPFFGEDAPKPLVSLDTKQRKPKRSKKTTPIQASETVTAENIKTAGLADKQKLSVPPPTATPITGLNRMPIPLLQPPNNNLTPQQSVRPLMVAAPRFHPSPQPPQSMPTQVYSMRPSPIGYSRSPYPDKYPQQQQQQQPPPRSQILHYPHAYDSSLNSFIQQPLRANVPAINPYSRPQITNSGWAPNSIPRAPPRQSPPMNPAYYSSAGPMPNPNFSIHQLLGNPYSISGLAGPMPPNMSPNLSQQSDLPPSNIHSRSIFDSSQQTPISTQSTQSSDPSSNDNRSSDKDTILGMSDVISFISDT